VTGLREEGVMPKEIVVSHGPRFYDEDGKEIPQGTQSFIQVSWSREAEYVQIVTGSRDPVTFDSDSSQWFFVSLERREINDLIRKLRRARDQAFGRDE
jgi:hypothetical protein